MSAPSAQLTDQALLNCADEPIAVPGAIQPHGALLALTEPDLTVVVASENAAGLLGADPLGAVLPDLLDPGPRDRLVGSLVADLGEVNPVRLQVGGEEVDVVLHRRDGLLITEWEP